MQRFMMTLALALSVAFMGCATTSAQKTAHELAHEAGNAHTHGADGMLAQAEPSCCGSCGGAKKAEAEKKEKASCCGSCGGAKKAEAEKKSECDGSKKADAEKKDAALNVLDRILLRYR